MSCTLCWAHLVSIVQEPVVEEAVGEEEVAAHDGKVEELAEDEPAKVDIVPEVRLCWWTCILFIIWLILVE